MHQDDQRPRALLGDVHFNAIDLNKSVLHFARLSREGRYKQSKSHAEINSWCLHKRNPIQLSLYRCMYRWADRNILT